MKVLHVATAFPRHERDPITPWLVRLLGALQERGVEVEVLASAYRGSPDQVVHGIPVRRFRYAPRSWETLTHEETAPDRVRRSPAHAALVPLYAAGGAAAAFRLGGRGYDAVHVHWPMPHALFGAALRARSGGRTPVVSSFYSVELTWVDRRMPWLRPFLRWTARTSDAITANSSSTAEKVRRLTGEEARVVPSPAPLEGEAAERATEPALAGNGPVRMLFVGRLVERKGVEYAVRALERLGGPRGAVFTVVGEGEWEGEVREAAREAGVADRVDFRGHVSSEELERLYREADLFVLPAVVDQKGDTEGLGVVLLEALLFERPVVASAVGGIVDIVKDGETGWLVPPRDPDALARAVREAAENPERARRLARRGRRHVLENFSSAAVAATLETVYAEVRRDEGGEGRGRERGPDRARTRGEEVATRE